MQNRTKKIILISLLVLTVALGGAAIYIGLQLQNQPNVGPGTPGASDAQCCSVPGSGAPCDGSSNSCGGGSASEACQNNNSWCWCATITNNCPTDPNQSTEVMCGNTTWDGNVTYSCPTGEQINDNPETFADCGRCGTNPTTPPPTDVPSCPESPHLQYSLDGGTTWQNAGNSISITDPNQQISFRMNNSINYVITADRQSGNNVCSQPNNFAGVVNSPCPMTIPYLQAGSNAITTVTGRLYQDNGDPWSGNSCRDRTTVSLSVTGTPTNTPTPTPTPGIVSINKNAAQTCNVNGDSSTVTYSITVTNADANSRTVTVTDTLDPAIIDSYVTLSSISNGGVYANKTITWTNLTIPAGGNITLTYQLVIPKTAFATLTNTVVLTENNNVLGQDQVSIAVSCLPNTALISDTADRILLASLLIVFGMVMYKFGLAEKAGQGLWRFPLRHLFAQFNGDIKAEILHEKLSKEKDIQTKKVKTSRSKFEEQMKNKLS